MADEYWQERKCPVRAFLKVWQKYIPADFQDAQPAAPRGAGVEISPHPAVTHVEPVNGSPQPAVGDLVALWNKHVPQAVIDWDPEIHAHTEARLRLLLREPLFEKNFEKLCQKAGKVRAGGGDDVGWLDFHWLLRQPKAGDVANWKKFLAGEYFWMGNKPKGKQDRESPSELVRRTAENIRKRGQQNAQHT